MGVKSTHVRLPQVFAWKIADELLARKMDLNSCYLAAQTMRSKLQNSFHELPQDSHTSLRDALLNHLSKLDDTTDGVIATQVLYSYLLTLPILLNVVCVIIEFIFVF